MDSRKVAVVFLSVPLRGHMVCTVEMAKQLLRRRQHTISVTVLILRVFPPSTEMAAYIDYVASSGLDICFEELPLPDDGGPATMGNEHPLAFISAYSKRHGPCVRDTIARLRLARPVAALVMDFLCTTLFDVAAELGIPSYIYFTSSGSVLSFLLYLPTLDALLPPDFEVAERAIEIPGLQSPVPPVYLPEPLVPKEEKAYTWLLYHSRRFREARGIIVNTFFEVEQGAVRAVAEGRFLPDHHPAPAVYPVGPNINLEFRAGLTHECLRWLDVQPPASVVFLCFGSMGSFGASQVEEIAMGLERSGCRFLWALRSPPKEGSKIMPTDTGNVEEVLPEGFLERTAGRGLVWPSWAPQVDVLGHPSTGGFVTHCGWNSCLESLWFGVPMLAWPLYADQYFKAFLMARDFGIAVELKVDRRNGNFVAAEELEKGVRCLMEEEGSCCEQGKKVRARAREMMEASRRALEEGGSSWESLERLADELVGGVDGAVADGN